MDVSKLKDSYPNAPVYSVSWEILFETDSNIKNLNSSISDLANSLQSDFPSQKPFYEFILDQKINLNETEVMSQPERKIMGSGFEIKNDKDIILIGTHKLTIITKSHSNFANFSKMMNNILENFNISFPVNEIKINRLGMRYINHCELPQSNSKRIEEFFNIKINKFHESSISNLNISFQEIISENLNFRTQYHSILVKNIPAIAIDLDCFEIHSTPPYLKFTELKEKSTFIAKLIKEKFSTSVTEKFVETVMEREK